jgi:hypothetical protein
VPRVERLLRPSLPSRRPAHSAVSRPVAMTWRHVHVTVTHTYAVAVAALAEGITAPL